MMIGTDDEVGEGSLRFINEHGAIRVIFRPEFSAVCSIGNAPFYGTFEIEYIAGEHLLEFEAFEEWLVSISLEPTTIEGITRQVFDLLRRVLGDIDALSVTCHAQTPVHGPATARLAVDKPKLPSAMMAEQVMILGGSNE